MSDQGAVEPGDDSEVRPEDEKPGINRQFLFGGIVVALTLAIAAWLAYGVVERCTTNPRAAGLVPDGANGASHDTGADGAGGKHGSTTTTKHGATTTTTNGKNGGHPGSSSLSSGQGPGGAPSAANFALLWPAYSRAWINECNSIWHHATNGKLYDPDDIGSVYTVEDCTRMLDQIFLTNNVKSVAEAQREGKSDADSFTEQLTLSGELCWIDPATDAVEGCWTGA
jgi:hypothetical protein